MYQHQVGAAARNTIIVLAVVAIVLVGAILMLPKGFSSDISIIGKGTPVAVLAHNKDSVQSLNLMDLLNKVRDEYSGKLEFRVVDNNTPDGRRFIDSQQVNLGTLLLFGAEGKRRAVVSDIKDQATLRSALDSTLDTNRLTQ